MGRYKSKCVWVREIEGGRVVFKDRETIWLINDEGANIVFHRWWAPRGSYAPWREFRRKLWRNKNLTADTCIFYAVKFGVTHFSTLREPRKKEGEKWTKR